MTTSIAPPGLYEREQQALLDALPYSVRAEVSELLSVLHGAQSADARVDVGFIPGDTATELCEDDHEPAPLTVYYVDGETGREHFEPLCVECGITDVRFVANHGVIPLDGIVSVEVRLTPAQAAVVAAQHLAVAA